MSEFVNAIDHSEGFTLRCGIIPLRCGQLPTEEIGRFQDYHTREAKLSQDIKLQYEPRAQGHTTKISHIKTALEDLRAKTEMGAEWIRTLLHSDRNRFLRQLKEAMNKDGPIGQNMQRSSTHSAWMRRINLSKVRAFTS